jgi:antitoxin PrlF
MRITSKGQVTIPKSIREQMGLIPGTEVEFVVKRGTVVVRRSAGRPSRGQELLDSLRRERNEFSMTTDEIMALTRGES